MSTPVHAAPAAARQGKAAPPAATVRTFARGGVQQPRPAASFRGWSAGPALRLGTPGDAWERQAETAASRVMAIRPVTSAAMASALPTAAPARTVRPAPAPAPAAPRPAVTRGAPVAVQRAPSSAAAVEVDEAEVQETADRPGRVASAAPPREVVPDGLAARIAGLRGGGAPLPEAERAFFEPRFGHDFARVRVHTGAGAGETARALGARAYALGTDVVFAPGEFRPGIDEGRRLLAHELAHVVQQQGGSTELAAAPAAVQRCAPAPCPAAPVPIDAVFPFYEAAERCIQEVYSATHPASVRGVSLSFNYEWMAMRGGTPQERSALDCLTGRSIPGGPHFTGPSGMWAGSPDIWDFRNTTMYEITTVSGTPMRVAKLGREIAQANAVTSLAACGGISFDRGTWSPPAPCYMLQPPNIYLRFLQNDNGVLVYSILRDATLELTAAVLMALLANAARRGGGAAGARALAGRAAGRLVPAAQVAALAAAVVLVASGRAEASAGPGGDDPLVALFQSMAQRGTPVPPDVQALIQADPALAERMRTAMRPGGDPTAAQREMSAEMLRIIAANRDQFTEEELDSLLSSTTAASQASPQARPSLEMARQIAQSRGQGGQGQGQGQGQGSGTGTDGGRTDGGTPQGERRDGGAAGEGGERRDGGTGTGSGGRTDGGTGTGAGQGGTGATLSADTRQRLAGAAAPVRRLWDALTAPAAAGAQGQPVTDAVVRRFLDATGVTPPLTDAEVDALLPWATPVGQTSADAALDAVAQAVQVIRTAPPGTHATGVGMDAAAPADAPPAAADATDAGRDAAERLRSYTGLTSRQVSFARSTAEFHRGQRMAAFLAWRAPNGLVGGPAVITPQEDLGNGTWRVRIEQGQMYDTTGHLVGTLTGRTTQLTTPTARRRP
jgi:hypothetical protein